MRELARVAGRGRARRRPVLEAIRPGRSRGARHRLHARLLAAIANLDLACAAEDGQRIAAAGADLVEAWGAVAAVMKIEEAATREPPSATAQAQEN